MAKDNGLFQVILNSTSMTNPSITVYTKNNLEPAQLYKFKVSAANLVGEGPVSPEIFVIAADMPQAPSSKPIVTLITESSISLTLQPLPSSSNGGSDVTGYIV